MVVVEVDDVVVAGDVVVVDSTLDPAPQALIKSANPVVRKKDFIFVATALKLARRKTGKYRFFSNRSNLCVRF